MNRKEKNGRTNKSKGWNNYVTENWLLHLKTNKRQVEKAQINQRENENREVTTDKRNFKTLKKIFKQMQYLYK